MRLQRRDSPGLFDQRMAIHHKGFEFSDDRIALATGDFSRQNRFQVPGHLRKFGIELLEAFINFSYFCSFLSGCCCNCLISLSFLAGCGDFCVGCCDFCVFFRHVSAEGFALLSAVCQVFCQPFGECFYFRCIAFGCSFLYSPPKAFLRPFGLGQTFIQMALVSAGCLRHGRAGKKGHTRQCPRQRQAHVGPVCVQLAGGHGWGGGQPLGGCVGRCVGRVCGHGGHGQGETEWDGAHQATGAVTSAVQAYHAVNPIF